MTIERPMFPPVDPTRRHFLTVAAGGAVAAAIPSNARANPGHAADPIYAAIERHKAAAAAWDAVMNIRARYDEADDDETQRLQDAADEAWEPCKAAAFELLNTSPTSLAGIVTAIRYIIVQ